MTLEVLKAGRLGVGDDLGVEVLVAGDEGDVHQAAVFGNDGALEHLGRIEEVIEDLGLFDVALLHRAEAADLLEVLEDLAADVDRPAVRRVVHGAGVGVGLILQIDGQVGQIVADEILADDDDDHAGGADVLLHAGVDHAVIADVAGLGEEHGRLVGHEDVTLGVGQSVPRHAVDRLIFADVDIVRVLGDVEVGAVGDVGIVLVLRGGGDDDLADLLRLGNGLLRPCAGLNVDGLAVFHQVHRDHGELERCAALNKQYLVVVGDAHEVAKILLGLVDDLLIDLRTVRHLHDAHAGTLIVHHFVADFFQNLLRHGGGTCGEIVSTTVFHSSSLLLFWAYRPVMLLV